MLSVALEQQPHEDFSERVMDRVAAVATVMEFALLLGAAPLSWVTSAQGANDEEDRNDDDDDDDDDSA
ncbi:hypothetical protein [Enhygromyxa salina]|uniref:hypothetical protein n=1 Tax=Enhygromyxa salina TaxID=215803 RepID=UPI0011B244CF|nr:hypothetical protein [Enhygromyxa salina]